MLLMISQQLPQAPIPTDISSPGPILHLQVPNITYENSLENINNFTANQTSIDFTALSVREH